MQDPEINSLLSWLDLRPVSPQKHGIGRVTGYFKNIAGEITGYYLSGVAATGNVNYFLPVSDSGIEIRVVGKVGFYLLLRFEIGTFCFSNNPVVNFDSDENVKRLKDWEKFLKFIENIDIDTVLSWYNNLIRAGYLITGVENEVMKELKKGLSK